LGKKKFKALKRVPDDYVAKTFQTEELLARISAVIETQFWYSGGPFAVAGFATG